MSEKQVIKQLEQYARKRHILIAEYKGLTAENLYDAKELIKEFKQLAVKSNQPLVSNVAGSPETDVSLMMFWAKRSCMNFKELQQFVDEMDLEEKLSNENDIVEQLGSLNLMLANLVDKLPVDKVIVDRVGSGTGSIVLTLYEVEYIDEEDDDDENPHFDLVLYTCQVGLTSFWDKGDVLDPEYWESDYLGESYEEVEKNLLKHEWLNP
jgi:hypothetical protein